MSWQHWILAAAYAVGIIASFSDDSWQQRRGDAGVLGGIVGILLLVWGQ